LLSGQKLWIQQNPADGEKNALKEETKIKKIASLSSVPRTTKISEIIRKQLKNTLKITGHFFKNSLDFERVFVFVMMDLTLSCTKRQCL
jgi:hypothetical protein